MRRGTFFLATILVAAAQQPEAPVKKPTPKEKAKQLLDGVASATPTVSPEVQVAALMYLAENYQVISAPKSLEFFERAFAAASTLPPDMTDDRRGELQSRVAALTAGASTKHAMEMLRGIGPPLGKTDHRPGAVTEVVRGLIAEREFDAAIDLVPGVGSTGEYPFEAAGLLFAALPKGDARRVGVFESASTAFHSRPQGPFGKMLEKYWRDVPPAMAQSALDAVVSAILDNKDAPRYTTFSNAKGSVNLTSRQDGELFNLMYVVRALEPKRAEEILAKRPNLSAALEMYPKGQESMTGNTHVDVSDAESISAGEAAKQQALGRERSNSHAAFEKLTAAFPEKAEDGPDDLRKALELANEIKVPSQRAEALAAIASGVAEDDPEAARPIISKCIKLLKEIKDPGDREGLWDGIAEAAHAAKDDALAWEAIDNGIADATELYRTDVDSDRPNRAPRDQWPSTNAYRRTIIAATKLFGVDAEPVLARVTDPDLAILARVEMAQALLGRPHGSWMSARVISKAQ